jgi:hypothetical protein
MFNQFKLQDPLNGAETAGLEVVYSGCNILAVLIVGRNCPVVILMYWAWYRTCSATAPALSSASWICHLVHW